MDGSNAFETREKISIGPVPGCRCHYIVCQGVTAEIVRMVDRRNWESRYHGSRHLLIAHERMARRRGETQVEGLPASNRQNLSHTLTFVPAGCKFSEWHEPDMPSQSIYIQIDAHSELMTRAGAGSAILASRLHFQNANLWQTVLMLKAWIETERGTDSRYADALGIILAHELLRPNVSADAAAAVRGGLTGWQRRVVGQYVEEHLAEQIPVAKLAALARLSRYHFCRSFRHSFGTSPHRYHCMRKVERAKELLAKRRVSVTDVAFDIGFHEPSSFTAAFRRLAGQTPSSYRRSLALEEG